MELCNKNHFCSRLRPPKITSPRSTEEYWESPLAGLWTMHVCQRRLLAAVWHHKRVLEDHKLFGACTLFCLNLCKTPNEQKLISYT